MSTEVYEWRVQEGIAQIDLPDPGESIDVIHSLVGLREASAWFRRLFIEVKDPSDFPVVPGDTLYWSGTLPVISERGRLELGDILTDHARLLPIDTPFGPYHVVQVTRLLSALIESESQVFRYPSGRIVDIERYGLDADAIGDTPLFKLELWESGNVLVTPSFIDAVNRSNLTGFRFERVWPVPEPRPVVRMPASQLPSAPSSGSDGPLEVLPIPDDVRAELESAVARGMETLGLALDSTPDDVQIAIRGAVADWHQSIGADDEGRIDLATDLGAVWGHSLCLELGWDWSILNATDFDDVAVIAQDRSIAVFPIRFLGDVLADQHRQTTLLLFNMLKAGVADAQPGELRIVS